MFECGTDYNIFGHVELDEEWDFSFNFLFSFSKFSTEFILLQNKYTKLKLVQKNTFTQI